MAGHPLLAGFQTGTSVRFCTPTMSSPTTIDRGGLEKIANFFKVFAEPTRLAILQLLRSGPHSVNQIVAGLDTSQANTSKQLRILYDADLLAREQRGNSVFYSIKEELVFELCNLVCGKLNRSAQADASTVYEI